MKFFKRLLIAIFFSVIMLPLVTAEASIKDMSIAFRGHVRDIGWMSYVGNGGMIGTTGRAKSLEALDIRLTNMPPGAKVKYQVHVQNIGWMDWVENGNLAGTTGRALHIEAIKIVVEGMPAGYHIEYQAHSQDIGWMNWVSDGAEAGTTGRSKPLEALNIRVVRDGSIGIEAEGHFQDLGWTMPYYSGNSLEAANNNLKIEGISLKLNNAPSGMSIQYQAHSQDIGWQNWVANGELAGTVGKNSKMEAFKVRLINAPAGWHVRYRAYVEGLGWQSWAEDGAAAGSIGQNRKVYSYAVELYYDGNALRNNIVYSLRNLNFNFNDFVYASAIKTVNDNLKNPAIKVLTEGEIRASATVDGLMLDANRLQFLTLNKFRDNMNVAELNGYLNSLAFTNGKVNVFYDQGQAFIDAARQYNIDTLYLVSHTMLETGYGTSALAQGINKTLPDGNVVKVYNFFGIKATDGKAEENGSDAAFEEGWTTPAAAIRGGARWIATNYIHSTKPNQTQYTLYYMRWNVNGFVNASSNVLWHQYATDVNWANKIASVMNRLSYLYKGAVLELEVPIYK